MSKDKDELKGSEIKGHLLRREVGWKQKRGGGGGGGGGLREKTREKSRGRGGHGIWGLREGGYENKQP